MSKAQYMTTSVVSGLGSTVDISLLVFLFLTAACQSEQVRERPEEVLVPDSMVIILTDMTLAEAMKGMGQSGEIAKIEQTESFYLGIWEQYGISRERFESSYAWYQEDLEGLAELYDGVSKRIKVLEDKANAESKREKERLKDQERRDTIPEGQR